MHVIEVSRPSTRERVLRRLLGEQLPFDTAEQMMRCLDSDQFEQRSQAAKRLFARDLNGIRYRSITTTRAAVLSKLVGLDEWGKDALLSHYAKAWLDESLGCARKWFEELLRLVTENGPTLGLIGRIEWAAVSTEKLFRGVLSVDDPTLNRCNDWVRKVAQCDQYPGLNGSDAKWWHTPLGVSNDLGFVQFGTLTLAFSAALHNCLEELKDTAILREPVTVGTPPTASRDHVDVDGRAKAKVRSTRTSVLKKHRQLIIRRVSDKGLTGKKYCEALRAEGLKTPFSWQFDEGCPKNYDEAHDTGKKWKHRIYAEKTRFTKVTKSPKSRPVTEF